MPVPDRAYFGPAEDGAGLNYGQIRALPEEDKFRALQRRFNHLLLGQVQELTRTEGGRRVVYSPFPLFVMTCVGLETAGKIFFSRAPGPEENEEDVQRKGFLEVCKGIHPISINLRFKQFVKSLHLAWSTASVLAQPLCDALPMPQQVSKRQRHLQHGDHTIPDLLEDLPSPLLATAGNPRGKKNVRHGSCAR